MVPVLDQNKNPLMPCSEKRARKLMEKGEALAYWQKGVFCIRLTKEPSDRQYQEVVLGIDPGSKREGYTVATRKSMVLNITTNTPYWVKDHVETRRALRRARRRRKTPYRVCRENRSTLKQNRMPPSTKARWNAKLRITKFLCSILPIAIVNVEDIKAWTKAGQEKWNVSFSSLEVGKSWFYGELEKFSLQVIKTDGYATKAQRDKRGFNKSKNKLDYTWEAHNVDSHCLVELVLDQNVKPYLGLYRFDFIQFYRRQLHKQNPVKGNIRKPYGTTVSLGRSRGSVMQYKNRLLYLGGSCENKIALHSIITGYRIKCRIKNKNVQMLYTTKWRTQFMPREHQWTSLRYF